MQIRAMLRQAGAQTGEALGVPNTGPHSTGMVSDRDGVPLSNKKMARSTAQMDIASEAELKVLRHCSLLAACSAVLC